MYTSIPAAFTRIQLPLIIQPLATVRLQATITSHLRLLFQSPNGPHVLPLAPLNLILYTAARVIF